MKEKKLLNEMSVKAQLICVPFLSLHPYYKCPIDHNNFNIDPIKFKLMK